MTHTDTHPAHSPQYADFENTIIDLIIEHPDHGNIPYTARPNDVEPLGRALYMRACQGDFGPIAPYDGPPPPDPKEVLAQQARTERNRRLAALDAIVSNPLRWAEFSDAEQAALASYRRALLNVPQQAGFCSDINWPTAPACLPTQPEPQA